MIDTSLKILWISDIHYSALYTDANKNAIQRDYLSSFMDYCMKLKEVDYILLSGDIAQSGASEEYEQFFNDILRPLLALNNLKEAELLVIPGNHYVDREESEGFFTNFINSIIKKGFNRLEFLTQNPAEFKRSFSNYSKKFLEFQDRLPKTVSSDYKENFLHGYFFDHKNA